MSKVSIVVYIRDSAEFLSECLASLQMQTMEDAEFICIDDGSEDASVLLAKAFLREDTRFKLKRTDGDGGIYAAWNAGIAMGTGEYIGFMRSEDWLAGTQVLDRLYDAAIAHDVAAVAGSYSEFDNTTNYVVEDFSDQGYYRRYTFEDEGMVEFSDWQGDLGIGRFLFKASFIREQGIAFPETIYHAKESFIVKALDAAGRFYAVPDVVMRHRTKVEPVPLGDDVIEGAVEPIAEILALCQQKGYDQLKAHQAEMMRVYTAISMGLTPADRRILKLRAKTMRKLMSSDLLRGFADIAGAYRSFTADVMKNYSMD